MKTSSLRLLPAAALLVVAACASPQNQVRTALVDAGVGATTAECMAKRMTDRLSVEQLRKLSRAKGAPGEKVTDLRPSEVAERMRRIDDPEVVQVVSRAAVGCSLGL